MWIDLVNILGGWEWEGGERAHILILCNSSCGMPGKHVGRLGGRGESTYFDTL